MFTELALPGSLPVPASVATPTPAAAPARPRSFSLLTRPAAAWMLFLVAVLAAYAPVLGGQFIWDDNYLVTGDPFIRSPLFVVEVFHHHLFGDASKFYRPTQTLTYMFDYWCWGTDPFGYHLTNALLQAANAFGLFLLLRRVLPVLVPAEGAATAPRTATDRGAMGIALWWALHPVHSATVAYISGRADSLAMAFCLAAWLACERALEASRPAARASWAAGAVAALLLGLCSKEIAFVWLVLFGCWLFMLRPNPVAVTPRAAVRTKLAVAGMGLLALVCYLYLRQLPPPPTLPPPYPPMPSRWLLMLCALGDYGRLMLFPDQLYMERQVFAAPGLDDPAPAAYYIALAVAGALVLAAFAAGVCLRGRGRLLRRVGVAWFLAGFLPISNLFMLNASVAEHWLYLPSIGFLLFLAGVALDIPWPRMSVSLARPGAAVAFVLAVAAALGGRTWLRAHDWTDPVTFYRQTIRDGGNTPRMRESLALIYYEQGDLTRAEALLNEIITRFPYLFTTRVNLATVLGRAGRTDEARAAFERLAKDLAVPEERRGGPREFASTVRALDRLEPAGSPEWASLRRNLMLQGARRFPKSWELVGIAMADRESAGDSETALTMASRFADAHWWHLPSHLAAGRLLAAAGRVDDALSVWKQAAPLDLRDALVPNAAAGLCLEQGRLDEALAWQRTAVRRQPGSPRQRLLLAQILAAEGRTADADRERETAVQLARAGES